jgi:hypothetical protein
MMSLWRDKMDAFDKRFSEVLKKAADDVQLADEVRIACSYAARRLRGDEYDFRPGDVVRHNGEKILLLWYSKTVGRWSGITKDEALVSAYQEQLINTDMHIDLNRVVAEGITNFLHTLEDA